MSDKHILGRVQITRECNQECAFCAAPPADKEPTLEKIKERIIELKEHDTTDLMLTGGEPFKRKDFYDVLEFAKSKNFDEITIQTNASLLTDTALGTIKDMYANIRFNVSFHSIDEETHGKISGKPENFEKIVRGLKLIGKHGLWAYPTIVISSLNYKQMPELVKFIRDNFPYMHHLSFNYIDPTCRAMENPWTVPKYCDAELYIYQMVEFLQKNNMAFRMERVPLCYMQGFEEFSSDIRRGIFDEKRMMSMIGTENDNQDIDGHLYIEKESNFHYAQQCMKCGIRTLCPGINPNYIKVHGTKEVFPVFTDPAEIVKRTEGTKSIANTYHDFVDQVESDLQAFKKSIQKKSNKNNIYDTYSFYLTKEIRLKDKKYIMDKWKNHVQKIKEGTAPDLLCYYIHIPYCVSNCDYCVYPSTTAMSEEQVADYVQWLKQEMAVYAPIFKEMTFRTLYIGGGTPSILNEKQLKDLLAHLFALYKFDKYSERSIEFNPRNTNMEKLRVLEEYGFNKFSIGVQTLAPKVLEKSHRAYQTEESVKKVIELFFDTKLNFLNIDLLLGLKDDTVDNFAYTFQKLCEFEAPHICIYPLKTNDDYVDRHFGNMKKFEEFYYPLFDGVVKKIQKIAQKHGYTAQTQLDNLSYVAPIIFYKPSPGKRVDYSYCHFPLEPYSNFALGYYAHSRITEDIDYVFINKNNPDTMFLKKFGTNPEEFVYRVQGFAKHFEKVKFIVRQFYKHWEVSRKDYHDMYCSDILDDFPYAIKALNHYGITTVFEDKITFAKTNEKDLYAFFLFFVGREWVDKK